MYADNVIDEMRSSRVFGTALHVEELIQCPEIHAQSFGTPDCWLYNAPRARVIIWDYKFGYLPVEVFENWQAINYYAGIADALALDGISDQHLTVEFRIVQPRAYHKRGAIRVWEVSASDLRPYINRLTNSARLAMNTLQHESVSGKQCIYCRGRHVCEAGLLAGLQLYEAVSGSLPLEVTPHALGLQLKIVKRALAQLKGLETGYTEAIGALLKSGTAVPFWNNAPSAGKEDWTAPEAEVLAMADLLNVDISKRTLRTPKQARDLGLPASVIEQFSKRKSSYKLEPVNDNETKEIFK
jgi:hypothetical protein